MVVRERIEHSANDLKWCSMNRSVV